MKRHNTFHEDIHQIRNVSNPIFRDLIALLWSKTVFNEEFPNELCFKPPQLTLKELIQWTESLKNIEEHLDASKLPLGKYAEKLLQIFFEQHPSFQLLAHNIQLVKDKETVGEIDFLLHDLKNEKHIHLEFALKFYLKTRCKGKEIFIGPNVKDTLGRKCQKLINSQSQLLNSHADLLSADLQNTIFHPKIWMKGVRFYPYQANENYTHSQAWWLNIKNIELLDQSGFTFECIKQKKDWIFPYFKAIAIDFETLKLETEKYFTQKRNALMLVRKKGEEVLDRGFIMREEWPNSH